MAVGMVVGLIVGVDVGIMVGLGPATDKEQRRETEENDFM